MRAISLVLVTLVLLAGGVALLLGRVGTEEASVRASLSTTEAVAGGDTAGFARALEPRPFVFPEDYGPHPEYRTEWWYLTGNLASESGDPFGFQVTFFRNSLAPEPAGRDSEWDTNQLWMAHFALTDVNRDTHLAGERFARGAAGMAGAEAAPFRIWLGNWDLRGEDGAFPMRVRAEEDGTRVDLRVVPVKGPTEQGDRGLSRKGDEPGNASYYLSWTRLRVTGTVETEGRIHSVRGTAWMDREWSTSALSEAHVGWDWFSLQLDDGRDLMFFELRRRDGRPEPVNHGVIVDENGTSLPLEADDVEIEVLDWWASPLDGTRYPSGWRLRVPDETLDVEVIPRIPDQEMNLSFRYWEGAVTVQGASAEGPVTGVGYVELTGYGEGEGRP